MLDPKAGAIIDVRNGYLRAIGDGAQMGIIVCLFKNHDGTYLIGVAAIYSEDIQYTRLNFYRYVSGNFVDVTKAVLPVAPREELKYEMPRFGTTIKVTDQNRHRLYNLVWNRQRFRLQRLSLAQHLTNRDASAGQCASQLTSSGDT